MAPLLAPIENFRLIFDAGIKRGMDREAVEYTSK